jgi:peroxiredoxin
LAFTFSPRLIDVSGNPLPGVRVILKDVFGNTVYDNTTDMNGRAPSQTIVVIKWVGKAQTGVNADTETNYNPFTLEVFKDNYKVYSAKITILSPMTQDITIPFSFTSTCYTNKSGYSLNENVIVTAEFRDLSGLGINSLSVNAEITKPDGTKETISLSDMGNGVYTGAYTNTNQVGTYYVEVTTTIYGNTVKARTSFDVGIIEKKIDEAKTEIISEVDVKAEEIKTHISESKPGAVFTLGT